MGQDVYRYDILISCPGDITSELKIIDSVVERFNQLFSDVLGIILRTLYWTKSSFSESGGKPQVLLNKQFVERCDAAIALFWTRFGTPTDEYGSGTEEEIQIMLDAGKQVFLGFSDKPIKANMLDNIQYKAVQAFEKKYAGEGVYFRYTTDEELDTILFAHLSQYFLYKKQKDDEKRDQTNLLLMGIENEELVDRCVIKPFIDLENLGSVKKRNVLKKLFDELVHIHLPVPHVEEKKTNHSLLLPEYADIMTSLTKLSASLELSPGTPVAISEEEKEIVINAAKDLEIWHNEPCEAFYLGSLKQIPSFDAFSRSDQLRGTEDEKRKYITILSIIKIYTEYMCWLTFEEAYKDYYTISLALSNVGSIPDEDIDLTLFFNDGQIAMSTDLPALDEATAKFIRKDNRVNSIFALKSDICYKDYLSSQIHAPTALRRDILVFPFSNNRSEKDMLLDDLKDMFCYEYFHKKEQVVLKLHFDYIKQNTAVAFPSVLFIDQSVDSIDYKICSKNCPSVIRGKLELQIQSGNG